MARAFDLRPLFFGDHLSRAFSIFVRHWLSLARWFLLAWFIPMLAVALALHTVLDPYSYLQTRAPEPELFALNKWAIYQWLLNISALLMANWFGAAGVMYIGARAYVGGNAGFGETARAVFKRGGWFTAVSLATMLGVSALTLLAFGPAVLIGQGRGSGAEVGAVLYAMFIGGPGFFLVLALFLGRFGLAPACVMLDDADSSSAFVRGAALSKSFRWRLYLLMFVAAFLTGLPGLWSLMDLAGLAGRELLHEWELPLAGDLLRLFWQGLFAPMFFLPLVVFYFDQRSRKEGYDIAVMARNFGIDEVELLRFQHGAALGYIPRGWKGGRLHPKPQSAPQPAGPWAPQPAQFQPPQPRAAVYRPPLPRGGAR